MHGGGQKRIGMPKNAQTCRTKGVVSGPRGGRNPINSEVFGHAGAKTMGLPVVCASKFRNPQISQGFGRPFSLLAPSFVRHLWASLEGGARAKAGKRAGREEGRWV